VKPDEITKRLAALQVAARTMKERAEDFCERHNIDPNGRDVACRVALESYSRELAEQLAWLLDDINRASKRTRRAAVKVTAELEHEDALLVGHTLRMWARVNGSPDPQLGERLQRVGDALLSAYAKAQIAARKEPAL
jgi:hypothetical protein